MAAPTSANHPTIYFDDGNVAFGFKNRTGGKTYFRVHKGYLSKQSTIVSDITNLPNIGHPGEIYDGVPLVVFPDSIKAETMETLLTFLYEPVNNFLSPDDTDIAYKLFGVFELADMLMMDKLKAAIVNRIKQDWAIPSVHEWLRRYRALNQGQREQFYFYEPASAIQVGRRFDASFISPLQFFELSIRSHLVPYRPAPDSDFANGPRNPGARWNLISEEDRFKAGRGHNRFMMRFQEHFSKFTTASGPAETGACITPHLPAKSDRACQIVLRDHTDGMTRDLLLGCHPFKVLADAKLGNKRGYDTIWGYVNDAIHKECAVQWDDSIEAALVDLFEEIPAFYDNLL